MRVVPLRSEPISSTAQFIVGLVLGFSLRLFSRFFFVAPSLSGDVRRGNRRVPIRNKAYASFSTLPWDIKVRVASFCSYSTVVSLEECSWAFRGLLHELSLVRHIANSVFLGCRFSNSGLWSANRLNIQHARSVCIATEMTIDSAGKSEIPITQFMAPRVVLAAHSHPLTLVMDLDTLQDCLRVAQFYNLAELIPDIAFVLVAAMLEQGAPGYRFQELKTVISNQSDGLPIIASFVATFSVDFANNPEELNSLPKPRLSLIPFDTLLGDFPSLLNGRQSIKCFAKYLNSSLSPSFLNCEWVSAYYREENDRFYFPDSVQSITIKTTNGSSLLNVSMFLNQQPLEFGSQNYVMTPFGLIVFWQGVVWLWKKEWCSDKFSQGPTPRGENEPKLIVRTPSPSAAARRTNQYRHALPV